MAKSARASSVKRNRKRLREKVYEPAQEARTERLSAKLQELVAKPKPQQEVAGNTFQDREKMDETEPDFRGTDSMDLEGAEQVARAKSTPKNSKKKRRAGRLEKKIAKRKAKSSILFAINPQQRKKIETLKARR